MVGAAIVAAWGGASPASAVATGSELTVSAATAAATRWSWNPGEALAAGNRTLLSAFATDCPPPSGECATDHGPYMGVYVQRAPVNGLPLAWRKPIRVSQPRRHAERAVVAAQGAVALAAWVTERSYLHYRPSDPRVVWVRASHDGGRRWRRTVALSSGRGRVDHPRVAAGGGRLFAVWTNADTGAIRFARSLDGGATWADRRSIGATTARRNGNAEGFAGLPDVGVSGDRVVVAWVSDAAGQTLALTSSDGGATFDPSPTILTPASPPGGYPAVGGAAIAGDPRIAIAYASEDGLQTLVVDGLGASHPNDVDLWPIVVAGVRYVDGYGPAVLPTAPDTLVLAVAACRARGLADPCDTSDPQARIDVLLAVSGDDGRTWSSITRLTDASVAPYRRNDQPSLARSPGGLGRVSFDRAQTSFVDYRVWIRSFSP
jgi:hypothetical protein